MREALLGVAVGKKGIGKTYTTLQIISSYIKGSGSIKPRKALILDVNDEFSSIKGIRPSDVALFTHHPTIEARRIRPYNEDGSKMTLNDIADTLWQVLGDYKGGLLLIEDINKFTGDYLKNDLVGALCTNRHSSLDIIMHFQSIGRVGTKIWQNINWLRFHKNTDGVDRHKKKFEDKYEIFKICEILVNKQYFNGNKYFYLTIDCDNEKIRGAFSDKMIDEAIDEYIATNFTKKVKPLVNQRDVKGKKKYTNASATAQVKAQLRKMYLG
ncbi:MAG TPA: hypothetical protein DCM40_38500 [Maribacter sp.]|nr:hypothetical protein [Maribacter sp.]|tara:strand:- start:626 stop:1432 length:807 start_codon:yes stop_codon:yes gene_type:complete